MLLNFTVKYTDGYVPTTINGSFGKTGQMASMKTLKDSFNH